MSIANDQGAPRPMTSTFGTRLMHYFYPVHYQLGMEMEQAMSQGRVDRMQAAMLWIIHAKGAGGWVARKDVFEHLSRWFELSEAKISRLLRALSSAPLNFIEVVESPESARQKIIQLTCEGAQFVESMTAAAVGYLDQRLAHLSPDERAEALEFMYRVFIPPEPLSPVSPQNR
ncbi:MarR family winged helix-turn-helix transcriptional regulator [Sphingopyxis sp.]|uniref:MarR family winged helix-turn-helix transcriptional regulator n=1 Tax=Sphingopyxis sp. TaxID=1908224 RepID=UPI003D0A9A44